MPVSPHPPAPALQHVRAAFARRFPELDSHALQTLVATARCDDLRRNASLLSAGMRWNEFFWVERGALRLYYLDAQGGEANKNFHTEDALIWPVTDGLRNDAVAFHIDALEPTRIWRLPLISVEAIVSDLPSWTRLRIGALTGLLDDKLRREQSFLQCSARHRYEALLCERPDWAGRFPLRHLASYLGMTDVSLSRLRAEMGLISG